MAFFYLKPDTNVPYRVTALGYTSHQASVSVASNATHLLEVNLCQTVGSSSELWFPQTTLYPAFQIELKVRVIDESDEEAKGLSFATLDIYIDNMAALRLQTDNEGLVYLNINTGMKVLTLQMINIPISSKDITFEFQDDLDFLKKADYVQIEIRENLVIFFFFPIVE